MIKYRIFGDTGGHYEALRAGLTEAGLTDELTLPEDVVIVHTGDLIHKGPASNEIVALVDTIMKRNPGQWIQLAGNHEAQYIGGIQFWRDNSITDETKAILREWHTTGAMLTAYGIEGVQAAPELVISKRGMELSSESVLLTHAGLGRPFWRKRLKCPETATAAAALLNELPIELVGTPGLMLEDAGSSAPGPHWAHSVFEVWGSWFDTPGCPFVQIFGHTSPFNFEQQRYYSGTYNMVRDDSKVNMKKRLVVTKSSTLMQIAIDPGFDKNDPKMVQPFLELLAKNEKKAAKVAESVDF